jgi:hypothetical protein
MRMGSPGRADQRAPVFEQLLRQNRIEFSCEPKILWREADASERHFIARNIRCKMVFEITDEIGAEAADTPP